ncbi:MAG: methionine--tRNA ligase subunit beta, partial [Bacteroidia bacterium]|nr:methionine--tRNA ligase subunit beta [Bacteroidia bacterium]
SRNWAVWLHEYLKEFPGKQDVLRYVLTSNAPETKDNDFTWKDFQAKNNNELVAIFGNFVNRTLVLTEKYFNGVVPPRGSLDDLDKATLEEMKKIPNRIADSLHHFRFREGLAGMMNLARLGNKYLTENEPWKVFAVDPGRVGTVLNTSLQICAQLSIVAEPFLPFTSASMRKMLGLPDYRWKDATLLNWFQPGHQLAKPELLFEKIDDKTIEKQIQKLLNTRQGNADAVQPPLSVEPPLMAALPEITYDDFSKLDIRAGTILEAEVVPKTDKLLKLKVDSGLDQRTIVSGIAQYFKPEDLIGKRVTILINLAPRKLRGIESQGMILTAENPDGTLYFITPDEGAVDGASVK